MSAADAPPDSDAADGSVGWQHLRAETNWRGPSWQARTRAWPCGPRAQGESGKGCTLAGGPGRCRAPLRLRAAGGAS